MRSDLCMSQAVSAEEQVFCLKLSEAAIEGSGGGGRGEGVVHSQRTPKGKEVPEYGNAEPL